MQNDQKFSVPVLDGIRAIAFIIVFLSHIDGLDFIPGGFGVTVFFFLSGYLISSLLRVEYKSHNMISIRNFYARRAIRILPTYLLTLVLVWAISYIFNLNGVQEEFDLSGLVAQLSFWANYWFIYTDSPVGVAAGSVVFWSLAVEEHFYLFYPVLFVLLCRHIGSAQQRAAVLAIFCIIILAWRWNVFHRLDGTSVTRILYATDTRFDSLFFGCILALYRNPVLDSRIAIIVKYPNLILAGALLILIVSMIFNHPVYRETFRYTIQGLALWVVFYSLIVNKEGFVSRLLCSPVFKWIGLLSFPLYLVHYTVIRFLKTVGNFEGLILIGMTISISLVYSLAVFVFVEKPLSRFRSKLRIH